MAHDWYHHSKDGYFEHSGLQMSSSWNDQRQYRISGGSWHLVHPNQHNQVLDDLIDSTLSPKHITVNYQTNLDTWLAGDFDPLKISGVTKEPFARHCYVRDYAKDQLGRVPGLCIPDPNHPRWSWLPQRYRHLLVHVAASPDWLVNRASRADRTRLVEIKCPQGPLYPDVVANHRARASHYSQMQANCGIVNATECDYYVWTPVEALRLSIDFNRSYFQRSLMNVLKLVEARVVPAVKLVGPSGFKLPADLAEYYWTQVSR